MDAWRRRISWIVSASVGPLGWMFDVAVGLGWLAYGWVLFLGRYQGRIPYLDLDSDTAQIASFAAAQQDPAAFRGDFLLSDPRNYEFYYTVQIPLARLVERLSGDLGSAFILPGPILVFLQGIGFYALGRTLFGQRLLALLFSLTSIAVIRISTLADYWGIRGLTTPRDWFQALFPFVLVLALRMGHLRPWRYGVMALTGILMYVHPVSTPPWTFGIWLALAWTLPREMSLPHKLREMALLAVTFAVIASPFFFRFLTGGAPDPVAPGEVLEIFKYRYQEGYLDHKLTFAELARLMQESFAVYSMAFGLAVLWLYRRRTEGVLTAFSWVFGLLLVGIVAPIIDHSLAQRAGRVPSQVDLIRAVRYLFPMAWLFGFWALAELTRHLHFILRPVPILLGAWYLHFILQTYPHSEFLDPGLHFAKADQWLPYFDRPSSTQQVMNAAKATPKGSRFFATNMLDASALRYYAKRPVVYSFKDGGALGYSNHRALVEWRQREKRVTALIGQGRGRVPNVLPQRLPTLIKLAREWKADYLLLVQPIGPTPEGTKIEYMNGRFTLLAL